MKTILPIILSIVLLRACSNQAATQSPMPLIDITAEVETAQPTVTHPPSPTSTLGDIQKTSTPDADTLRTQAFATIEALYPKCYLLPANDSGSEISPDGRWLTMDCRPKNGASNSLQVASIQGDKLWNIYYGDHAMGIIPATNHISPTHWSGDGKYLFATVSSGNEGCCFISNAISLIRLNLDTGKLDEIVSYPNASDNDNGVVGVDFSISPSDRYALYIPQDGKKDLYILDLISNETRAVKIKFENTGAGFTRMSNDDKNVVLMLMEYPPTPQPDDPYLTNGSIVVINLDTGLQRKLLSGMVFDDTPMPFRWKDDSNVELHNNGHVWLLNIHTQELTGMDPP